MIVCGVGYILLMYAIFNIDAKEQVSRHVDGLLRGLERDEWTDDETLCKSATLALLNGVKNHTTWATWIWDAMQQPVSVLYGNRYHLGSFEQCLDDPWAKQPTQYCLVDIKLAEETGPYEEVDPNGSVEEFVKLRTKFGARRFNFFSLGVCLPAVCSSSSIAKISRHIHQQSHLPFGNVTVDPGNCYFKGSQLEYSIGFYVFWAIILITTTIATTVYVAEDILTNTRFQFFVDWFSPSKNFKALIVTNDAEILSLNGIRSISAGTIVVLHYLRDALILSKNPMDVVKSLYGSVPSSALVQLVLLNDVFFLLSGLLQMKGLMRTRSGLLIMIWKKYIRLLGPLAMTLLFISSVLPHLVSGPLHNTMLVEEVEICIKNWLKTTLMTTNFVRTDEISPYVSWFISCDIQLTIIGTAIFWCCKRLSRPMALGFCLTVYSASLMIPALLTYWMELPFALPYDIDLATVNSENRVFQATYIKPYSRASAYLNGLALGYIMHVYSPQDYRKTISKKWSILGGILGFVTIVAVMTVGGILNLREYNVLHAAVYCAVDKSVFSIGLCVVIVAVEYGTLPLVGDLFCSKVFVPLSRLSYGLCLYHLLLLWQTEYSIREPIVYNFLQLLVNGLGYIVVSYVISYLLWFIIEAPVINITNSLFQRTTVKPSITKNGGHFKSDKQL